MSEPTNDPDVPSEPQSKVPPGAAREVLGAFALVFVGTWLFDQMRRVGGGDIGAALTALMFVFVPLRLARREPNGARRFGIDLGGVLEPPDDRSDEAGLSGLLVSLRRSLPSGLEELGFALLVMAVVFPPFAVGFRLWHQPSQEFVLRVPDATFWLSQLFLAALPEEVFFRGFVMTRLHDAYPPRTTLLRAPLHLGVWIAQAALFALVHLAAEPGLARLAVFFPGLLFGWIARLRGGVAAAALVHAGSNVLSELLITGYSVVITP